MAVTLWLLTLIVSIFITTNAQQRIPPKWTIIKTLQGEPTNAQYMRNKNTRSIPEPWSEQPLDHYAQQRILPLKTILKTLHREPPIAQNVKNKNAQNIQELWIEQPLDHWHNKQGPQDTWQMRYFRNDKHYKPGGAIFIFVGGEWEISDAFLQSGHMYDMAVEHHGIMYYTEHRYYGRSWPTNNTNMENLQYIHSSQALGDLTNFIQQQKSDMEGLENSPVILIGTSYSGSMVTWFTKLFPGIATAAWASSAPILAKLDFYDYLEHVGATIKSIGGEKCYQRIQNGISAMQQIFASNDAHVLFEQLKLCNDFDESNKLDLASFFNYIGNYFGVLVQSDSDNIKPTCDYLMALHPDDDLAAFTVYLKDNFWSTSYYHRDLCIDMSYAGEKQLYADVNDLSSDYRQWFYQTCNEFGWFTTSIASTDRSKRNSPFGHYVNLYYFQQLCADVFGDSYTLNAMEERIQSTNDFYSAEQPAEGVFMTYGQLDPWSTVGQTHGANVLQIPGYSHSADLDSININDSILMNLAKEKVASFISQRIWRAKSVGN